MANICYRQSMVGAFVDTYDNASSIANQQHPREQCAYKSKRQEANAHVERLSDWQASQLEEVGGVADKVDS